MVDGMKDSGIEWIGEIPAEWDVTKLGSIATEHHRKNDGLISLQPIQFSDGSLIYKPNFDASNTALTRVLATYHLVDKDDIVLNGLNMNYDLKSKRVAISKLNGCITSAYIVFHVNDAISCSSSYLIYLLKCYDIHKVFHGMGRGIRQTIKWKDLSTLPVVFPPFHEQRRIAAYLDNRVSKIDRLVSLLSHRLSLLDEYKKSLISETVTHGLEPNRAMKDSGIEWIGEIPAEWDVAKCQYVMMSDKKIAGMRSSEYQRISLTMNGVVPRDKNDRDGLQPRDFDSYQIVRQNQLIFKLIDLANKATSRVGLSPYEGITSPAYIIASCDEGHLTARYAYYYFTDMYFRYVFNGLGNDGVRSSLTKTALMNLKIVLPPLHEQREIAAFLDERVSVIDRLMDACRKQIDSLGEYKKSLISECVTGKRRITDADLEGVSVA